MHSEKKAFYTVFFLFVIGIFVAFLVSVCVGKYPISITEIIEIVLGKNTKPMTARVFTNLRLPRTIMAIIAGIGLGIAGSVYQIVFKNPLASPDIIGTAGGANLGAAISIVLFSTSETVQVAAGAFWGGLLAVFAVLLLVKFTGNHSTSTYVLAGIIINAITRTGIMILKYFADSENELAAMEYWEMGTFGNVTLSKLLSVFPMFLIGVCGLILLRRQIELLALNDNEARSLGVRVVPIRIAILVLATLLVGSIVSITGLISFVGLIAPHTSRLILKKNDSSTIILSGLIGAFVLLCSDILVRVMYTAELPISILTTVIGVPILLYFLIKRSKRL